MDSKLEIFLSSGLKTSVDLQEATGLSQAAVSRRLRNFGTRIVKVRQGRSLRYGLRTELEPLCLASVDQYGNTAPVANLSVLTNGGFYLDALPGFPSALLGMSVSGYYDGLPFFLNDLRPQGFLGRNIARQVSRIDPEFSDDPRLWSDRQVLKYLTEKGSDLPGAFKLGPDALARPRSIAESSTVAEYPQLADQTIRGAVAGSSAGGEQPKFTTYCAEFAAHVIVKFSPVGNDPVARRWKDILLSEHHAAEALHQYEIPAAETRIHEIEGRIFLESSRIDRSGDFGRLPMISMLAVDAEFVGSGSHWPKVMRALHDQGRVSHAHVFDVDFLWHFGRFINNTDMHLGNLSFGIDGDVFRILPAYDMCSMGFAPSGGHITDIAFSPPADTLSLGGDFKSSTEWAQPCAELFWDELEKDPRISPELRDFLSAGNPIRKAAASVPGK